MTQKFKTTWIFLILIILIILGVSISCQKEEKNNIQIGESAVVQFIFENLKDSIKLSLYNLPIFQSSKFSNQLYVLEGDKYKEFIIPCEYPSGIYFTINNSSFTGYLSPKDTLKVTVQLSVGNNVNNIQYEGKTKLICNYYLQKKQQLGYQDLRIPLNKAPSDPKKILENTDTLMRNELNFLRKYTLHTQLPDWFIQTEKSQIIYLCNLYKQSQKSYFEKYLNIPFKPNKDYYNSIDTLPLNNQNAHFSYWYYYFLKSYLVYDNIDVENKIGEERKVLITKVALSKANEKLTGEIRDVFKYNFLNYYLSQTKDLNKYDQILLEFGNDFINKNYLNDLTVKRSLLNDSIVKNRNDGSQQSAKNGMRKNDSVPYFYLPDIYGKYLTPKFFEEKLVYVNFWATGCKPCIASIPQKNDLIQKYANNPAIAFLNICISSKKENWEKMIEEKNLGGINLFANENWSNILRKKFGISGIPKYFLIRDGKVIKPYCDAPENIEDDLKELLEN